MQTQGGHRGTVLNVLIALKLFALERAEFVLLIAIYISLFSFSNPHMFLFTFQQASLQTNTPFTSSTNYNSVTQTESSGN